VCFLLCPLVGAERSNAPRTTLKLKIKMLYVTAIAMEMRAMERFWFEKFLDMIYLNEPSYNII